MDPLDFVHKHSKQRTRPISAVSSHLDFTLDQQRMCIEMFCSHDTCWVSWTGVYVRVGGVKLTCTWAEIALSDSDTTCHVRYYSAFFVKICYFDYLSSIISWYFLRDLRIENTFCTGMTVSELVFLPWISIMLRPTHADGEFANDLNFF